MNIQNFLPSLIYTAQAAEYGIGNYGDQVYSCEGSLEGCVSGIPIDSGQTTTTPPNTGFMGMSSDAAFSAISGGTLLLVALIATIIFVATRSKKKKHTKGNL